MGLIHDVVALGGFVLSPAMTRVAKAVRFEHLQMQSVTTMEVPTREGPVTCTVYRPDLSGRSDLAGLPDLAPDGRLPVLLNFHGGGFILGNPAQDDHICRYLAHTTPCVVINVEYTTAPFKRYPAQIHQGYDVTRWISEHPDGWDGARVAAIGHSAGGMLVAALTHLMRFTGVPPLKLQILDYPGVELVTPPSQRRARTARPLLPPWMLSLARIVYCPEALRYAEPLASPGLVPDLRGLPPAVVVTADLDILRDEADLYARRLADAGVAVRHHVAVGVDHAFTSSSLPRALEAFEVMVEALRSAYEPALEDSR